MTSDKLHAKSDKCYFLGYPRETKGYYFYSREEGKVFVAWNGIFLEKEFFRKGNRNNMLLEEVRDVTEIVSEPAKLRLDMQVVAGPEVGTPAPRRSSRVSRAPER